MITHKDLVIANLIHYFNAVCEIEKRQNRLLEIEREVGVHSPSLDGIHGYNGTRDEKLAAYSNDIIKIQDELKGWENERKVYWNVLHLHELDEQDIQFLTSRYKDKLTYEQISKKMFYNSKQYAQKKDNALIEKLSKYI